jgi:3-phosphoshikimate 1-carboxyvinyltransferase
MPRGGGASGPEVLDVDVTVSPGLLRPVRLVPPHSKSDAQRALVLAHVLGEPALSAFLGEGNGTGVSDAAAQRRPTGGGQGGGEAGAAPPQAPDCARGRIAAEHGGADERGAPPPPTDVTVMAAGLAALERAARTGEEVEIDCRDGGAPFRLLLGQAAVTPGARVRFTGTPRLGERPHGPLLESLRATLSGAGLQLVSGAPWPLSVTGASGCAAEPCFRVDAAQSSQFPSSLLLAAASLHLREHRPWAVELVGPPASGGYLALTVAWLRRSGFELSEGAGRFAVHSHSAPRTWPTVPGDWSSLGYLLLLAWASGGRAAGVDVLAAHPDRAVLRVLADLGLRVDVSSDGEASVSGTPCAGLRADGDECPDLLPTLAALACVLPAPSVLTRVSILRAKESDRLSAICDLVHAAGGRTHLEGERLHIQPPEAVRPFTFDARGDHRLALSASVLAVLGRVPVQLRRAHGVDKSFPGFFTQLQALGCDVR